MLGGAAICCAPNIRGAIAPTKAQQARVSGKRWFLLASGPLPPASRMSVLAWVPSAEMTPRLSFRFIAPWPESGSALPQSRHPVVIRFLNFVFNCLSSTSSVLAPLGSTLHTLVETRGRLISAANLNLPEVGHATFAAFTWAFGCGM